MSVVSTVIDDEKINGDYAGWFQAILQERYPGTVAMFVAGCGADANPLPRFAPGIGELYGQILATAVQQVLEQPMEPLTSLLSTNYGEATIPFETPPTREELLAMLPGRGRESDSYVR